MIFRRSCVILSFLLFIFSCSSTKNQVDFNKPTATENPPATENKPEIKEKNSSLTLLFAGDIMAHEENFSKGNFNKIWQEITPILSEADFSFANIESPVNDKMDWKTYPQFNMKGSYINAAIKAGFNVFSLANNHTNDWYLQGIKSTQNYFSKQKNIYYCGIKSSPSEKITYQILQKNGFKILFVAVTELLNRNDYSSYIDYFPPSKRNELKSILSELSSSENPDAFIISIHTNEEEYNLNISEERKTFYNELIQNCGIDIIWANHPHCPKEFELVKKENVISQNDEDSKALIMYANGNTISGQRRNPSLKKEAVMRDYTGDGLLVKITLTKENQTAKIKFSQIKPYFISTYIEPSGQFTVKLVDEDLIHSLNRSGLSLWADYFNSRKILYEKIIGKSKWQ